MIKKKFYQLKKENKIQNSSDDIEGAFNPEVSLKCPITDVCIKVEPSGALNKKKFKDHLDQITIEQIVKFDRGFLVDAIYDEAQFLIKPDEN